VTGTPCRLAEGCRLRVRQSESGVSSWDGADGSAGRRAGVSRPREFRGHLTQFNRPMAGVQRSAFSVQRWTAGPEQLRGHHAQIVSIETVNDVPELHRAGSRGRLPPH